MITWCRFLQRTPRILTMLNIMMMIVFPGVLDTRLKLIIMTL